MVRVRVRVTACMFTHSIWAEHGWCGQKETCGQYSAIRCHMHVHVYSGGHDIQCMQAQRTNLMDTENQYIQGQNLRTKDQSYWPMVTQYTCKRTIL